MKYDKDSEEAGKKIKFNIWKKVQGARRKSPERPDYYLSLQYLPPHPATIIYSPIISISGQGSDVYIYIYIFQSVLPGIKCDCRIIYFSYLGSLSLYKSFSTQR